MSLYFWRTYNKYKPRFLDLVMIQGIKYDPMVNKYVEAENIDQGRESEQHESTRTGGQDSKTTHSSTGTYEGDGWDKESSTTHGIDNSISETRTVVKRKGKDKDTTHTTDKDTGTGTDKTTHHSNGGNSNTRTLNTTHHIDGTYTSFKGSHDEHTSQGSHNNDNNGSSSGVTREATKSAPMSAVNIPMTTGDGKDSVAGSNLGNLDFTFASGYGQNNNAGISKGHDEGWTHDEGDSDSWARGEDTKDETTTDGGTITDVGHNDSSGSDDTTHTRDYAHTIDTTVQHDIDETDETGTNYKDGKEYTEGREGSRGNHDENTTTDNGNASAAMKTYANMSAYDDKQSDRINRNRLTGRDGMTPQAAMREAEEYLRAIGPAIQYMIDKLEICFIGVYDV